MAFTISSSPRATQTEGGLLIFSFRMEKPDGTFLRNTTVPYEIVGLSASDIVGGRLSGSVSIDQYGSGSLTFQLANDQTTEGNESVYVRSNANFTPFSSNSVTVYDTSLTPQTGSAGSGGGTSPPYPYVPPSLWGDANNDIITGSATAEFILGKGGNDSIQANGGDDTLDGGEGADTLIGGAGNDVYMVDFADTVIEAANEGVDTVRASSSFVLGNNLENLLLVGTAAVNGTGNALANALTGNAVSNSLDGGAGNDTLDGGGGADTLIGGAGNDTFITDGSDAIVEAAGGGTDTVQTGASHSLAANVEYLTLTGTVAINGTGNELDNVLTGNTAANRLAGGAGSDTYFVDAADTVVEAANEGIDTVRAASSFVLPSNLENLVLLGAGAVNGTGNALQNVLTGNAASNALDGAAGNDTLDGGGGVDTLAGGASDDTFVTDGNDVVVETEDGGIDTVQSSGSHSLAANVENLTLTGIAAIGGTGNELNNILIGNAAVNTLAGGAGDDLFVTDGKDVIVEAAYCGLDTVQSSGSHSLAANVENLTLTGIAAVNGTGNNLSNVLTGNSASNRLEGGDGWDTLIGGLGNDTYVTDGNDTIIETASDGIDRVLSSVSYALVACVENLTLTGTAEINATGNGLANLLIGNSGSNVLDGGGGDDVLRGAEGSDRLVGGGGLDSLEGGVGADAFVFRAETESANILATADTITDFVRGVDRIDLSAIDASSGLTGNNAFVWLGTGIIGTATSGDLRYQKYDNAGTANDYTLVIADTDSDTASEFMIRLVGLYDLAASDFLL